MTNLRLCVIGGTHVAWTIDQKHTTLATTYHHQGK
jgi:hypothetical protein